MAKKRITSVTLFDHKSFEEGEVFVSDAVDITGAIGYFSCHCILSGAATLTAEVSLDETNWVPLPSFQNKQVEDVSFVEHLDIPVSCYVRFKVEASTSGSITLLFAYV